MTKSRILWFTLLAWSVLFVVFCAITRHHYHSKIISTQLMGWNQALAAGLDPSGDTAKAAFGFWFLLLLFVWFTGALPLFISAVVTRLKGHHP
jgi:hypothetical protein